MLLNDNKISIQGIEGSFHHTVALKYFNKEILNIESLSEKWKSFIFTIQP